MLINVKLSTIVKNLNYESLPFYILSNLVYAHYTHKCASLIIIKLHFKDIQLEHIMYNRRLGLKIIKLFKKYVFEA